MIILYAIIAIVAIACFTKMLHFSIQPKQWLGAWDDVLHKWDRTGHQGLAKMFGYCEMCFSHLLAFIGYVLFVVSMVVMNQWDFGWFLSIVSYFVFIPISTMANLFMLRLWS